MSKKHFIELADCLRDCKPEQPSEEFHGTEENEIRTAKMAQWELMRDELARFCKRQNSAFMRDRWIDYIDNKCGKNGGPKK